MIQTCFNIGMLVVPFFLEGINKKQSQGKKPDGPGDWLAIVEAMGTNKTKDPQQVANQ